MWNTDMIQVLCWGGAHFGARMPKTRPTGDEGMPKRLKIRTMNMNHVYVFHLGIPPRNV